MYRKAEKILPGTFTEHDANMEIHTKTNNFQQYHEIWMTYLQMINSFFLNILKYTVNGIQQHPEL